MATERVVGLRVLRIVEVLSFIDVSFAVEVSDLIVEVIVVLGWRVLIVVFKETDGVTVG